MPCIVMPDGTRYLVDWETYKDPDLLKDFKKRAILPPTQSESLPPKKSKQEDSDQQKDDS